MAGVRFLQIEPTTRCNFTCGFCCGRSMPQEDLEWETFVATLDALPDLQHVELQGEGESLLHARFHDMVAELGRRDVRVSFITNGSLLHPGAVDRLLSADIDKISVSIESPDPEEFRRIRGGKLEKVLRNLRHLMDERRRRGLVKPVVGLSVTVLSSTWDALPRIYDLYRDLGLDGGITLQPLQGMDSYAGNYDDALRAEQLDDARAEIIFMKFFSDAELRDIQAHRGAVGGFYEDLMAGWRPAKRTCPYLEQGLYVNRRGDATPCCMVKDAERFGLGRVGETPLDEMLARRDVYRRQLAAGTVPEPCTGCPLADFAVMSTPGLMWFGLKGAWQRWFAPRP